MKKIFPTYREINLLLLTAIFSCIGLSSFSQKTKKVWFDGQGRAFFAHDKLGGEVAKEDTTSLAPSNGGYTLLDLDVHINPSPAVEIASMIRLKNDFGGFWGAGVEVQLRQLYLRGIVGKKVHYGIGDLFFRQSRFTLWNTEEEGSVNQADIFNVYREVVHYENFYQANDWRMQGMQVDFALDFARFIQSMEFNTFIARNRSAVLTGLPDRLFGGGGIKIQQSKKLSLDLNYVSMFDLPSTISDSTGYNNPVVTGRLEFTQPIDTMELSVFVEAGYSSARIKKDLLAPEAKTDFFAESGLEFRIPKRNLSFKAFYRFVGPDFRSAGAQTRRFNASGLNTVYPFTTELGPPRPVTLFDLMTDDLNYNQGLSSELMPFIPIYQNSNPYGDATPNRSAVGVEVDYQTGGNELDASVAIHYQSEIIGQGTEELRNFLATQASFNFHINELLDWEKKIKVNAGVRFEKTSRGGAEVEQVDLSSLLLDAGLTVETFENFELLAGVKFLNASGNEFYSVRDYYGEIQNFPLYYADQMESIIGCGAKYSFGKGIYLTIQGNWNSVNDRSDAFDSFKFGRLLALFNISF